MNMNTRERVGYMFLMMGVGGMMTQGAAQLWGLRTAGTIAALLFGVGCIVLCWHERGDTKE